MGSAYFTLLDLFHFFLIERKPHCFSNFLFYRQWSFSNNFGACHCSAIDRKRLFAVLPFSSSCNVLKSLQSFKDTIRLSSLSFILSIRSWLLDISGSDLVCMQLANSFSSFSSFSYFRIKSWSFMNFTGNMTDMLMDGTIIRLSGNSRKMSELIHQCNIDILGSNWCEEKQQSTVWPNGNGETVVYCQKYIWVENWHFKRGIHV